jgi:hypothetical protein
VSTSLAFSRIEFIPRHVLPQSQPLFASSDAFGRFVKEIESLLSM